MEYIVLELKPKISILHDVEFNPIVYKTKCGAFKAASMGRHRIIVPLIDILTTLEGIKLTKDTRNSSPKRVLNEIFDLLDEII